MRDPQTVPAVTFDHFDFFFSSSFFIGSVYSGFFFFFFFLFIGSVFSSGFFIFIFFILASVSLGIEKKKKEKATPTDRYGPTNSVKNIER